jgi:hypothetical protein
MTARSQCQCVRTERVRACVCVSGPGRGGGGGGGDGHCGPLSKPEAAAAPARPAAQAPGQSPLADALPAGATVTFKFAPAVHGQPELSGRGAMHEASSKLSDTLTAQDLAPCSLASAAVVHTVLVAAASSVSHAAFVLSSRIFSSYFRARGGCRGTAASGPGWHWGGGGITLQFSILQDILCGLASGSNHSRALRRPGLRAKVGLLLYGVGIK